MGSGLAQGGLRIGSGLAQDGLRVGSNDPAPPSSVGQSMAIHPSTKNHDVVLASSLLKNLVAKSIRDREDLQVDIIRLSF